MYSLQEKLSMSLLKYIISMSSLLTCAVSLIGCIETQPTITAPSSEMVSIPVTEEIEFVPLCTIVGNPNAYDGKRVRTRASIVVDLEVAYLYDTVCRGESTRVHIEFGNEQSSEKLELLLGAFVRGEARGAVATFTGRFENSNKGGYGHLDSFAFQFVITDVEEGRSMSPDEVDF